MKGARVGRIEVVLTEKKLLIVYGEDVAIYDRGVYDEMIEALVRARDGIISSVVDEPKGEAEKTLEKEPFKIPAFPESVDGVVRDKDGTPIAVRDPVTKKIVRFGKKEPHTKQEDDAEKKVRKVVSGVRKGSNGSRRKDKVVQPLRQIEKKTDTWPVIEHFLRESNRPKRIKEIIEHLKSAGYVGVAPVSSVTTMLKTRMKAGSVVRSGKKGMFAYAVV